MKLLFGVAASLLSLLQITFVSTTSVPILVWSPHSLVLRSKGHQQTIHGPSAPTDILEQLKDASSCYVVFEQPKMDALEFSNQLNAHSPNPDALPSPLSKLKEIVLASNNQRYEHVIDKQPNWLEGFVADVVSQNSLVQQTVSTFGDVSSLSFDQKTLIKVNLSPFTSAASLAKNVGVIMQVLENVKASKNDDFIAVYTTSVEQKVLVKRGVKAAENKLVASNGTGADVVPVDMINDPLFAKYMYFSPGIFQGLFAFLTILFFALVGMSWLAALQVPSRFEGDDNKQKKQ